MFAFIIVGSFAVIVGSAFYFLGRRRPNLPLWRTIDLFYYPLGILGVVLLFVSAEEGRQRLSILTEYQEKRQNELAAATRAVLTKESALARFVDGVADPTATCAGGVVDNQWLMELCRGNRSAKLARSIVDVLPAGFKVMALNLVQPCKALLAMPEGAWQHLYTVRPETDESSRETARKLLGNLAVECNGYEKAFTRVHGSGRVDEAPEAGSTGSMFPTPNQILVAKAREWLWPFVLIFALSLKVGRAAASLPPRKPRIPDEPVKPAAPESAAPVTEKPNNSSQPPDDRAAR